MTITGDDFGASHEVNHAIIQAHERGVLTHASLLVTGSAFQEAVTLAKAHPRLRVGLHLVVSSERAVLPPEHIPNLVNSTGFFSSRLWAAGIRYWFSGPARRQICLEVRAQLEKFRQTGLPLSHVDGHQHMHLHPIVFHALVELADEFEIRLIRLPWEELGLTLKIDRSHFLTKLIHFLIFGRLRKIGERRLEKVGIRFSERVYGLLQTGRMTEEYLLRLIPKIQADRVEIYLHPTLALESATAKGASRAQLDALLSRQVREALVSSGFELASYL